MTQQQETIDHRENLQIAHSAIVITKITTIKIDLLFNEIEITRIKKIELCTQRITVLKTIIINSIKQISSITRVTILGTIMAITMVIFMVTITATLKVITSATITDIAMDTTTATIITFITDTTNGNIKRYMEPGKGEITFMLSSCKKSFR